MPSGYKQLEHIIKFFSAFLVDTTHLESHFGRVLNSSLIVVRPSDHRPANFRFC
jgi:hypothetical protein